MAPFFKSFWVIRLCDACRFVPLSMAHIVLPGCILLRNHGCVACRHIELSALERTTETISNPRKVIPLGQCVILRQRYVEPLPKQRASLQVHNVSSWRNLSEWDDWLLYFQNRMVDHCRRNISFLKTKNFLPWIAIYWPTLQHGKDSSSEYIEGLNRSPEAIKFLVFGKNQSKKQNAL